MNKIRMAILALTGLTAGLTMAQENYTQWTGLRSYYLNTAANGANVAGTVRNFPVLIQLGAADSAIFTAAKAAGVDLRFSTRSNRGTRRPGRRPSGCGSTPCSATPRTRCSACIGARRTP
jgi:hypothetical protein